MHDAAIQAAFPALSQVRMLASSGQKNVYSAVYSGVPVVLKLLKGNQELARLGREIAAVQRLASTVVPRIYAHGPVQLGIDETYYTVEQLVPGMTLRQVLQLRGALTLPQALQFGHELLRAACEFEAHGLVHRDIKPENLMIDGGGKLWVIDFGIVRVLDMQSLTASDQMGPCTLGYGAPEQLDNRREHIDIRADLFAIGVVLYEVLCGYNPHRSSGDWLAVLESVRARSLPRLSAPGDPHGELADLLASLTSPFLARRPRNARDAFSWFNDVRAHLTLPAH